MHKLSTIHLYINLLSITLHLDIENMENKNPLYFAEPFTRYMAYNDLVNLSKHNGRVLYKRGNKVVTQNGQIGTSSRTLAARWQWSRGKVERFLNELNNDGVIEITRSNIATIIQFKPQPI